MSMQSVLQLQTQTSPFGGEEVTSGSGALVIRIYQ